jgi:hypothetical protein
MKIDSPFLNNEIDLENLFYNESNQDSSRIIFESSTENTEFQIKENKNYPDENEFDIHETINERQDPEYQRFLFEVNSLVTDWSTAIKLNRYYSENLGWKNYYEKINKLLLPFSGYNNVSLSEEAFAQAVANWQASKGLSAKDADGIIGPNTWKLMQTLFLPPGSTAVPPAGTTNFVNNAQLLAELNSHPNIRNKYQTTDAYKRIRDQITGWNINNPADYLEAAISDWNSNPGIQRHFGNNFDGDAHNSYLNLKRLYQEKGISNAAVYFSANIVSITFFNCKTSGHKDLQKALSLAQSRLTSSGVNYNLVSAWSFVPRTFNANTNKLSNHALGKAIDINPSSNPHITSSNEISVINAVCVNILRGGLLTESNPDTLINASSYFQSTFNDNWINGQSQNIKELATRNRSNLNKYAKNGFMTLPTPLVTSLQNAGLGWGGTWKTAKDFMHFELPNS